MEQETMGRRSVKSSGGNRSAAAKGGKYRDTAHNRRTEKIREKHCGKLCEKYTTLDKNNVAKWNRQDNSYSGECAAVIGAKSQRQYSTKGTQ